MGLGLAEGAKEDKAGGVAFLTQLKDRGLVGAPRFLSDAWGGLIDAIGEWYPEARWQRCAMHFYRKGFRVVPTGKIREVAQM